MSSRHYGFTQGNITVTGRESPKSLYSSDLASMEIEDGGSIDYEPADAQASMVAFKRFGGRAASDTLSSWSRILSFRFLHGENSRTC